MLVVVSKSIQAGSVVSIWTVEAIVELVTVVVVNGSVVVVSKTTVELSEKG